MIGWAIAQDREAIWLSATRPMTLRGRLRATCFMPTVVLRRQRHGVSRVIRAPKDDATGGAA